jgi:hypothetical protein
MRSSAKRQGALDHANHQTSEKSGEMSRHFPGLRGHRRQLKSVTLRSPEALEVSGREGGERTAAQGWVDDQMGGTQPAGIHKIKKAAAAEAHGIGAILEHTLARFRAKLRRKGVRLTINRRRLETLELQLSEAPEPELVADSSRSAWVMASLLVGLCLASAGLDAVVFEVLGLGSFATWAIALAAGSAQVLGAFDIGAHHRDRLDGHTNGKSLLIPLVSAVTALGVGLATAALRASKMVAEGKAIGLPTPSLMTGFFAFAAVSLVIDGAALIVGERFGSQSVRKHLVIHRNRNMLARRVGMSRRRFERARGRLLSTAESALGHVRSAENHIYKSASERGVENAGHYEQASLNADPFAGAALATQINELPHPDEHIIQYWHARCRAAEAELIAVVEHYGEKLLLVSAEDGYTRLRLVGSEEEAA